MDTYEFFFISAGLNAIYVHTHATNEPAFKLYVKKGFEVMIRIPTLMQLPITF